MDLTRRNLLLMSAGALTARSAQVPYREYSRCLPDYLRDLALAADARRSKEIAAGCGFDKRSQRSDPFILSRT